MKHNCAKHTARYTAKAETYRQDNDDKRHPLTTDHGDIIRFGVRVIAFVLAGIALLVGAIYSFKPQAAAYLLLLFCVLGLLDLHTYWVYELGHNYNLAPLLTVDLIAWALFCTCGTVYSVCYRDIPLFGIGSVPIASADSYTIYFGEFSITLEGPSAQQLRSGTRLPIFNDTTAHRAEEPVIMYVDYGRLFCDFDMYAGHNDPRISVRHNRITKPLPTGWDANSNGKALEVVDNDMRPVFQMYAENASTVVINGLFRTSNAYFLAGDRCGYSGLDTFFKPTPLQFEELSKRLNKFCLKRLFKYPSAVFPGVPN